MSEKIDPTWIAYALDAPTTPERLEAGVARVHAHYGALVDYPLRAGRALGSWIGLLTLADAEPAVRWPAFAASNGTVVASAYPVTGWRRVIGEAASLVQAPIALGEALLADPTLAARELPAPAVIGVLDRSRERLLLVNDFIGAGRFYEHRFEGGAVWSNRAAAPALFSGRAPEASERGWQVLAAAGWPVGEPTPFRDVAKVAPGTVIEAGAGGLSSRRTHAVEPLVRTRRRNLKELAANAAERSVAQVRDAAEVWPGRMDVDLSGGRDSRTVAGAVVRAGADARFLTSDATPGEADVARQVVAAAPVSMPHSVRKSEDHEVKPHERPVSARALNVHLLHDGMRHPQKLRGKMTLPRSRPSGASLSGHGGDVAHGYFYKSYRDLWRLRLGGEKAIEARVRRLFAKDHAIARTRSYEVAQAEVRRILAEGRAYGVRSPIVLEYFYLVDRFANRSGVAAHAERVSIFGTHEFVEAAFALRPAQRIGSRLHRLLIAQLVPQWSDVPFFKAQAAAMRKVRRLRLWEAPADAADVERVLGCGGAWTELYDADRARGAWAKLRAGGGKASWEGVFEGIVYREAFDAYLEVLRAAASAGPPLVAPRA